MIFLSLIAVLAIVYWTSAASIVQHDGWFILLLRKLRALPAVSKLPLLPMVLAFAIPLLLLIVAIWAVVHFFSANFLFFIYVPVLLYSLGRGNFITEVNNYIAIANRGDMTGAKKLIDELCGHAATDIDTSLISDWKSLHVQMLKVISYRGFERTFAVLFWFVIAGAVGALLYRLSIIYREQTVPDSAEAQLADRWLWLIELPAVRLMGLTWAFVGNFDSCPWQESLLDTERSSMEILNSSLRGALSAPTDAYINAEAPVENEGILADGDVAAEKHEVIDIDAMAEEHATIIPVESTLAAEIIDVKKAESHPRRTLASAQEADENAREVIEDLVGVVLSPHSEPAYSFALVKSSVPLYSRSLLFWVGAIAFATLFI